MAIDLQSTDSSPPQDGVWVPISRGLRTLIDADDFEYVKKWSWSASVSGKRIYVVRNQRVAGRRKFIALHRDLMGAKKGFVVDHINNDTLDNRRCNLRICRQLENTWNRRTRGIKFGSKFRGVYRRGDARRWTAWIHHRGKKIYLGLFVREEDAGRAYDEAVLRLRGEYGVTNQQLRG